MAARDPARQAGFTLIEMVVLIIIMATASAIIVPAYGRMLAKAQYERTVAAVIGLLAWARTQAAESGAPCTVTFDAQSGTLAAVAAAPPSAEDLPTALQETEAPPTSLPARPFEFPETVTIADFEVGGGHASGSPLQRDVSPELVFREDGTTDGAILTIVAADGYRDTIEVSPATGRAYVVPDEQDDRARR